jgi:serine/threonine protein kinase/Tol biopolymer transport system component
MISPSNWEEIRALFHSALERAPDERAAFLRAQSHDDEIVQEVASLLAAHVDADALLAAGGREADASPVQAGAGRGGSPTATLPSGVQLGPYVVVSLLGAGAMGEVYRARDTNLRRDVALKVLPALLAANRDRLARFTREARTLGALNHPHIAQVHGFEAHDGVRALVMELVEGQDLAQHVTRGPIRVEEALRIARQIAEALEAAHARGIVHRDLKPANIMVRDDGTVKVLDFGLAKAWMDDPGPATPPVTAPPSSTTPPIATEDGVIVGTAAYMSPEQARGGAVDRGSDIWAFGCVLYEMLTGARAFDGASAADTLANVLQRDPAWDRLPDATPPSIRVLLRRCLRKDRRERLHDAAGVRIEIDDVLHDLHGSARTIAPTEQARVGQSRSRATSRLRSWAAGALGAGGLAAVAYAVVGRWPAEPRRDGPVQAHRLTAYAGIESAPSLSADGSQVAFSWNGPTQDNHDIYIKVVGPGEPIRLTDNRTRDDSPAWSPDGQEIAFLRWAPHSDETVDVMVVPALGHAAERRVGTVTLQSLGIISRLSWTPDGHWLAIGVDTPAESRGLWLLSRDGRPRRRLTISPHTEFGSDFNPAFSSDGRHMAFIRPAGVTANAIHVLALSPAFEPIGSPVPITAKSERHLGLAWSGDDAALVFSSGGHQGQTRLQRISLRSDRLAPSGPAVVLPFGAQATSLSLSRGGRLVYVEQYRDSNLERVNLAERASGPVVSVVAASTYDDAAPTYSRDGRRIAFQSTRTGTEELWVSNADGTNLRQVTFLGGPHCGNPQWSPSDDQRILFNSPRDGRSSLYVLDLATGTPQRLTTDEREYVEARWSRDGKWIYAGSASTGRQEVWRVPATGGAAVQWTRNGGMAAIEGADGFLYYARAARSPTGIWRMPVAGGPEALVVEGLSYSNNFALGDRGLYFVSRGESMYDTAVEYLEFGSLTPTRLVGLGGRRWWYGVALSPDEQWFMYSVVQNMNSNLMVVDGVR